MLLDTGVKKQSKLSLILLFAFACVAGIVTMYFHEMWRDESQAFLMARDSKNLWDLWQNVRYEGHPFLWHFILFASYHLFPSIYIIQVVHLIIGLSVIAVIVFYSPFSFIEKLLLTCSYFFSFEYLIISRNYAIGVLFLLVALFVLAKNTSKRSIAATAILLGLAANCNIYSLIISCWLFVYFLFDSFLKDQIVFYKKTFLSAIFIFCFLLMFAAWQIFPPADRTPKISIPFLSIKRADQLLREIPETLFYIADAAKREDYWGASVYDGKWFGSVFINNLLPYLPAIFAVAMLFFLFRSIKKSSSLLLFYTGCFVSLLLFTCFIFDKGFLRHLGAFFILIVMVSWLSRTLYISDKKSLRYFNVLFTSMLFAQCISSVIVHVDEIKYRFSGAKDAALFLIKTHRNNDRIILHPDYEGMSLLHYAQIKKVYYATIKGEGSFIRFNTKRKAVSYREIANMAVSERMETIIFNSLKNEAYMQQLGYTLVYKPTFASTVKDEVFYIYSNRR